MLGVLFTATAPAEALTAPTLKWSKNVSGHIVQSSPSAVGLDGGTKDIVVGAWDGKVYGLRGEDGAPAAGWPAQTAKPIDSSAAVADVDQNGSTELFIGSGDASSTCAGGGLYSYTNTGVQRCHFKADDLVSTGGNAPCSDLAIHGSPAIGDVNFDNEPDAVFGSLGVRSWLLSAASGRLGYGWPYHWDDTQFSSPALGDINNDGKVDVVATGDASLGGIVNYRGGLIRAISGLGQLLWEYKVNEAVYSSPVIGDVDGDGQPEIVVGAGDFYANNGGSTDSNKVFVLDRFGQLKWSRDLGARTLAAPALADFNGDGVLDIGIGTWTGAQAGKIYAIDGGGNNLPNYPRASGGNLVIGQLSTADFDNDGGQDILTATGGGVYCYSGKTGALLFTVKNFGSFQDAPLIEDLDSNGLLDIVIAGSPDNSTGVIERYEVPAGSAATLGTKGWPKYRKDARQTGSWLPAPAQNSIAAASRNQLTADQTVQKNDYLLSPNGQSALYVQPDGNLTLYRNFNKILWDSRAPGSRGKQLIMQSDGNLVLYNSDNFPIWNSRTGGNPGSKLVVQDDGNVVLYSAANTVLWFTGTNVSNSQAYINDTQYGGSMYANQEMKSADGRFRLVVQTDGNIVLYSPNRALWQSGTAGKPFSRLTLQSDGNLVVYTISDQPTWFTGTNQRSKLIVQNDGNLVLYNGLGQPLWNSRTGGQL
jgi:hypothetical protein